MESSLASEANVTINPGDHSYYEKPFILLDEMDLCW